MRLQPEVLTVRGVTVKGTRPQYRMVTGGTEVAIENTWFTDLEQLTTSYQTEKLEVANTLYTMTSRGDEDNFLVTDLQADDNKYRNTQHSLYNISNRPINEYVAADYALNDSNSIGASYRYYGTLRNRCHNRDNYDVYQNDHKSLYLQLNMSEKTHRPSYRQLRSFKQYDNRYLYEGGNPELQPEKVFNIETELTYKWINAAVGYKYTDDVMEWTKYVYPKQTYAESTKNCYYYTRGLSLQVVYNLNARHSKYRGTGAGNEERGRL